MKYSVVYKDLGKREFKEIWDYQKDIFTDLFNNKKERSFSGFTGQDHLPGTLITVEHPHVYTMGKNGSEKNLRGDGIKLVPGEVSFFRIDRGGDVTYHGPGQIVLYPIFDLELIKIGLKEYVFRLEEAVIRTVGTMGITSSRLKGGTGVWIDPDVNGKARKICAIGVKASRYITMHGLALNVNTDLSFFNYINPCGFTDKGVTSIEKELGNMQDMEYVKGILRREIKEIFNLKWINQ